jgi:predicted RNase H-like nuclease (RuvC/YqgF family)
MVNGHGDWHLRKEVSIGTLITLIVLGVGALAGYFDTKALAQNNSDKLENVEGLSERITRIETQLTTLREQQIELKSEVASSSVESREAELAQLRVLQEITNAIARLETQLENMRDN